MSGDTFEVRDPALEALMRDLGNRLADAVSVAPGYGFALLIFSYGEGGNMFYTSSAERGDVVKAMREFILRQERRNA